MMHMRANGQDRKHPDINSLINQYGCSLLRTAMAFLGDYYLAQDAVQETYIKVYKKYYLFHGNASEKTWITSILINTCKDILKSPWRKNVRLDTPIETLDIASPDDTSQTDSAALVMAITRLTANLKAVILLFYYHDQPIEEVSKSLKISKNTVRVRLNRARAMLKQFLKEEEF